MGNNRRSSRARSGRGNELPSLEGANVNGLANVGPKSNREIAKLGQRLAGKGMSVSTIGVGDDYNCNTGVHNKDASLIAIRNPKHPVYLGG